MKDFKVSKFKYYTGPNYYLNNAGMVFNLYVDPEGNKVDFYEERVLEKLPQLAEVYPNSVVDLFAKVCIQILKMDINLYINNYSVMEDNEEFAIAVECLVAEEADKYVVEDSVYFVSEWFNAINEDKYFNFEERFLQLQDDFDRTLFGGPTLYSLIEGGLKRGIPVNYLYEENEFQWGYGKKQIRGRSTTFHVDGIKDTEFTMFKDMCSNFLEMCGFPVPTGKNCFTEDEVVEEAERLEYPVVVKPVAGHKGQGVTTGIETATAAKVAFQNILKYSKEHGVNFDGAIVQKQIYGTDHRLLAVGGKFAAALQRVPAYVVGDGKHTIEELIEIENDKEVRLDNARSPLCKINIDEDLMEFLKLQSRSLNDVPKEGERIELRRVANISAGGVSINVTDKIHPDNKKLVEDIAKYFTVTCLGIDVLAKDISQSWREGSFGIIEINAGPGVFMHLAPAIGGSVDVPGMIMRSHFPQKRSERIPIITGNKVSLEFCQSVYEKLKEIKEDIQFGSLTDEGIYFNGEYFYKNPEHDANVKIILRDPTLEFAMFNHTKDQIFDYGIWHEGADIVILEEPHYAEESLLEKQLLADAYLIFVTKNKIKVYQGNELTETYPLVETEATDESEESEEQTEVRKDKQEVLLSAIKPLLKDLVNKYE